MVDHLLRRVRSLLRGARIDFVPYTPDAHPLARRMHLLSAHGVDVVFDVGANIGQYAQQLRDVGYTGWIVSFEPLASAYRELARRAARDDRWKAVPLGLGPTAGEATLHVAANSQSSSLLPQLAVHARAAPDAAVVGTETVTIDTLASALATHADLGARRFVKIDAQGYERAIVESGGELAGVVGLQLEMSLVPLYDGESVMTELIELAGARGFRLMSLEPGYADPQSGQLLQVDGVFFRK